MFIKKRKAMEILQVVVLGMLLVALGTLFTLQFSDGIYAAGEQVNDAANTTANGTFDTMNNILEAESGGGDTQPPGSGCPGSFCPPPISPS